MKNPLLLNLLIFISLNVNAQPKPVIISRDTICGRNFKTGKEIIAREYIFTERIYQSYIDTARKLLTVQLRGTSKNGKWMDNTGDVILYDLEAKKAKWSRRINYQQTSIDQLSHLMIETTAGSSYSINVENGETLWEVRNSIYYIDPKQNIGIGYKFKSSTGYTNKLEGIDLASGSLLWTREIDRTYSWNSLLHLNDSVILVVAAGLHTINLKNGTGWDYETITGEKDYTATAAANAAGVALGILTGAFAFTTGYNVVRDVVSNVLVDSSFLYFASKDKISCLDHHGRLIWSQALPKNFTSKSAIFLKDDVLYMINKGYAFMGYRQLGYGRAFIAAFDKIGGKQFYLNFVDLKNDQVNGFKLDNNNLLLVFNTRIAKYALVNGSLISDKSFPVENLGELNFFIGGQVYVKSDSAYLPLISTDTSNYFLFTKMNKTLAIDNSLEIKDQIEYDRLLIDYARIDNYMFLAQDGKTIVVDADNNLAAEFSAGARSVIVGRKLYEVRENSFAEVDLSELVSSF